MADVPSIIKGDASPQLQRQTLRYDPQRGYTHTLEYQGIATPTQNSLLDLYNDNIRNGVECSITYEKDKVILNVNDSTGANSIDTWQIVGSELTKDGLTHPYLTQFLSPQQVMAVRAGITSLPSAQTSDDASNIIKDVLALPNIKIITDAQKALLTRFIGLQGRGATEYRVANYVLRHTTNVPNNYQTTFPFGNADRLFSTVDMIADCTNSTLYVNQLPPVMAATLATIDLTNQTAFPIPASLNYAWAWLKGATTQTSAANNRVDIASEYTYECWSTDYYAFHDVAPPNYFFLYP